MMRPAVFSFVDDQRRFLCLLIGFMTFLIIASAGVALSISNAIGRFNADMDRSGIIIARAQDMGAAQKITDGAAQSIERAREIDSNDVEKLVGNWLSGGAARDYIPKMIQVQAKTPAALDAIAKRAAAAKLKFVHSKNAAPDRGIGIKIILISTFVFLAILAALIACIIHSVKNIVMIHRREIEILNQVGAMPKYIAGQMQRAMLGIGIRAAAIGLAAGWAMLLAIGGLSRGARVGLIANMGLDGADWLMTLILAAAVAILVVAVTRRAAIKILEK
jgi:cell division protein FtsX